MNVTTGAALSEIVRLCHDIDPAALRLVYGFIGGRRTALDLEDATHAVTVRLYRAQTAPVRELNRLLNALVLDEALAGALDSPERTDGSMCWLNLARCQGR